MRHLFILFLFFSTQILAENFLPMKQYSRGHWGVEVTLNDQTSYPFIIDTGAQGAIFPSKLVETLGGKLEGLPELEVQGAVGSKRLKQYAVESMRIGENKVENIDGVVMDIPFKKPDYDDPGVLPYTFLNQFAPLFDFANHRFSLLPKAKKGDENAFSNLEYDAIPFELKFGSFIHFELNIDGQAISATLDSGAGNRIDMNWSAANALGINKDNDKLTEGDPIQGASGQSLSTMMYPTVALQASAIQLGNRSVTIADVPILKMMHGDKPAANVGLGIFEGRQVIIDYQNQRLLVSDKAHI